MLPILTALTYSTDHDVQLAATAACKNIERHVRAVEEVMSDSGNNLAGEKETETEKEHVIKQKNAFTILTSSHRSSAPRRRNPQNRHPHKTKIHLQQNPPKQKAPKNRRPRLLLPRPRLNPLPPLPLLPPPLLRLLRSSFLLLPPPYLHPPPPLKLRKNFPPTSPPQTP